MSPQRAHFSNLQRVEQLEIEEEDVPPDGGYGWICVASCSMINFFSWGVVASYGVYLSHYLADSVFPNASSIDFAFIGGFNFSMAMIVSPIVTISTRKYGKYLTMSIGIAFQTAGFIGASFAIRIWQLYLTQGLLVGFGIGFLYIPSTAILSQWFKRRRSLANGISSAGSGVGGACFAWATEAMIQRLSIPWALRTTGVIVFIANSVATAFLRDRNRLIKPPQLAFDWKLLRRYDVQLLLLWAFVSMLGYITLLFSLSDFALSIGLSQSQATNVVGLLNVGTAIGRPVIGIWSDAHSRIHVAAYLTLICGLSCFAFWIPATTYGLTIFFALFSGAILGVFWVVSRVHFRYLLVKLSFEQTIGPVCVEVAGLKELPSLLSISWMIIVLPTTCMSMVICTLPQR
ncbi:MFS general substrate transporter [Aureobasidium pullulans]|uniref:MFS general substrate transporter n=1 Tax=Aureobasidium pullulans TaxID=5580 RepID=A0A4S9UCW7_AURPU|nr:MFS general substrate transporter [Aureobasidium pullulans]THV98542.1 MFS general substrate transporter [Aureobasidium pullulans]THW31392.1 MFS general substrate transporter [Aureobasidium pullulans]THX20288.1 MFS general substrate transporter [Aureobasidium pullulans]THX33689.1 MFS general substrate transporter [Aureobasidium pullulans]